MCSIFKLLKFKILFNQVNHLCSFYRTSSIECADLDVLLLQKLKVIKSYLVSKINPDSL